MRTLKQFRSGLLAILAGVALSLLQGCSSPCPTSSNQSCNRPNPLVTLEIPNTPGFGVTPDTIAQATSVVIEVSGKAGAPKVSFIGQPGVLTILNLDSTFQRPLQLKFIYQSSTKETLAEDQIRIDDTRTKGVVMPDMDVVVGVTSFPSCPGTTQSVGVNIIPLGGGLKKSEFIWAPGESFEVNLALGSTNYKFRIHPEVAVGAGPSKAVIYERPHQLCLSDITTAPLSRMEMEISNIPGCTITGKDDGTIRTITIQSPNAATITVSK